MGNSPSKSYSRTTTHRATYQHTSRSNAHTTPVLITNASPHTGVIVNSSGNTSTRRHRHRSRHRSSHRRTSSRSRVRTSSTKTCKNCKRGHCRCLVTTVDFSLQNSASSATTKKMWINGNWVTVSSRCSSHSRYIPS